MHQILRFHIIISVDTVVFMESSAKKNKKNKMQYVAAGLDSMAHLHELVN